MRRAVLAGLMLIVPMSLGQTPAVLQGTGGGAGGGAAAGARGVAEARRPGIVIEDADPAARSAVHVEGVKIRVAINAPLAQTTVTLTFRNTMGRPLEGTLEFPLPENAAVVGYALDVPAGSGTLVEGVCVEKERARRIFETEQRRGIDPGLVEQTRGNNYRTRVHPIPAGGTRTVQLTYVSDLAAGAGETRYTLPLEFAGNLKTAAIEVEVVGGYAPEQVRVAGLEGMAFRPSELSRYPAVVAEKAFGEVRLGGALTVTMPALPGGQEVLARVERREKRRSVENVLAGAGGGGEAYFLITAEAPLVDDQRRAMQRVGIVWDTSLSRAGADRSGELGVIRALAARLPNATFQVFSTEGAALKTAGAGEVEGLAAYLGGLPCDGALQIDGFNQKLHGERRADTTAPLPDVYLFFTDGRVTVGARELVTSAVPVYTVCGDAGADHGLLAAWAEAHRGRYLNLGRMSAGAAVEALLSPGVPMALTWDEKKGAIAEVYPKGVLTVAPGERVTFTGRLLAAEGTVELNGREVRLTQEGASTTGIVPRFWAQQKAAALGVDVVRNGEGLAAVGKEFGIVTPVTSLLVLETVDQYVRHRVVPPQSAKELYNGFVKQVEAESVLAKGEEEKKIERVLGMWQGRVEWWNKTFAPPTREQVAAAKQAREADERPQAGMGGAAATSPGRPLMRAAAADARATTGTPAPTTPAQVEARLGDLSANYAMLNGTARDGEQAGAQPTITIKAWSPDTPYLRALKGAKAEAREGVYLAQRKAYQASPAFYLDCANYFLEAGDRKTGVRILTNIAQLRLEDAAMLRVAAYRLLQIGEHALAIDLFEQVKALRPDEPQSWRDLALAYAAKGQSDVMQAHGRGHVWAEQVAAAYVPWQRAMELYHHVVMNRWERFEQIEVIALMEANALWAKIQQMQQAEGTLAPQITHVRNPFDPRLVKNLECDLRIVLTWDADVTDIDLHVVEPNTEEAFYGHNLTGSGGMVSRDFTEGYGPEEYVIRRAPKGAYTVRAKYYGSRQQTIQGPVTVQATVITNFGRSNEKRESLTLRLTDQKEMVEVGEVKVGG